MTRRERGRTICRRVAAKVQEVTPPGLGEWEPAWSYVAEPSDRFLDLLDVWLYEDTPRTREDLQEAADALVRAWREAGRRYEADQSARETQEGVPA